MYARSVMLSPRRLGPCLVVSALVVGACTSFGAGGEGATPDGSAPDATPDATSTVPPIPLESGVDGAFPIDAGPRKSFCDAHTSALFCSSFDGTSVNEGWDGLMAELANLTFVPSTKSPPNAMRVSVVGNGSETRPNGAVTKGIAWSGSGIVVDVDIDAGGVPATTTGYLVAVNVAISIQPPRSLALAFSESNRAGLFVFDRPDGATAPFYSFTRPATGFAHYQIRVNFVLGLVSVLRDGTEVVPPSLGLRARDAEPVFFSAGLEADPGVNGSVTYDNYVVTKLP